jgi:hypothetical protein
MPFFAKSRLDSLTELCIIGVSPQCRSKQMTVRELIAELSKLDPNRLVVMSSDAEGNSYSPLSGFWVGAYKAKTTWSGEVGYEVLTDFERKHGYTEADLVTDGVPAIILQPMN